MSSQSHALSSSAGRRITPSQIAPRCRCGLLAPLKTALTKANTGHRFYGCVNYERGRGCGYFSCFDAASPEHLKSFLFETLQEKEEYKRKYHACLREKGDLQMGDLQRGDHRGICIDWGFRAQMWIALGGAFLLYLLFA